MTIGNRDIEKIYAGYDKQNNPLNLVVFSGPQQSLFEMKTLAALYGYIKPGDAPETWGADALIESPEQLATWITSALCH